MNPATPQDYQEPLDDYEPAKKAITQAASHKYPKIIVDNIEAQFREVIANKTDPSKIASNLFASTGPVKKWSANKQGMMRAANSFSIDRVFDVPHNPFRSRLAIETPQNLVELYQRFRYYAQREPLVGTALELHTEFPLSQFQLVHEDPVLREDFNDLSEHLDLFEFLLDAVFEYWCLGEFFSFGIFDDPKNPQIFEKFILLNPVNMEIMSSPITDGRGDKIFRLRLDRSIQDIIKNGPGHEKTGELYKRIPQDIIDSVKSGDGTMQLPESQTAHFKRKGNYFKVRGESILYRIIHLLNYRDKMRDSQYSIVDRNGCPREVWKIGETDSVATDEELAAFSSMLSASYMDPSQAIVWHHAVQVEVLGGSDKLMPLRQELDGVESEMLTGLMLNKGFLDSSYGAYANMSVSLDVLIARYMTLRTRIEKWIRDAVFAPVCRLQNIYKPTQAELAHRIRIKNADKRPWTPTVHWDKQELRDNNQKVNLLMTLREKLGKPAGIPRDMIYQAMNINPASVKEMLRREKKEDQINNAVNIGGSPGGPTAGGGMSVDLGGLGAPIGGGGGGSGGSSGSPGGGSNGTELNIDPSQLPSFNKGNSSPGGANPAQPQSSQSIQNSNTPTNVGS